MANESYAVLMNAPVVYRAGQPGYRAAWAKAVPEVRPLPWQPEDDDDGVARIFVTFCDPDGHYWVRLYHGISHIVSISRLAHSIFEPQTRNRIGDMGAYRDIPGEDEIIEAIAKLTALSLGMREQTR